MTIPQQTASRLTVGVSRDFLDSDGRNVWGGTSGWASWMPPESTGTICRATGTNSSRRTSTDLTPSCSRRPRSPPRTFAGATRPPALLARFGVGYDAVDLDACTRHGVLVTITPDGARRPVAVAALTLLLAVMHNVTTKDRLVREGRWSERTR
jgi:hypothetical protein